jgi:hypothetical protein
MMRETTGQIVNIPAAPSATTPQGTRLEYHPALRNVSENPAFTTLYSIDISYMYSIIFALTNSFKQMEEHPDDIISSFPFLKIVTPPWKSDNEH